ncbi:MAG TPA: hypothetical protein VFV63_10395 [Ilumatobacteraceae bacterium]|nr:hypothetical protein [Ilumatobacteraceae bacterium]
MARTGRAGDPHHRSPEWDQPAIRVAALPDQEWPAGAGQMTENFLDMGHLAFLHAKTFALRLRIEYYVDDVILTILFFHQPVDANTTKLYCFDLRNDIAYGRTTIEEAVAFQLSVAAEDRAMLEKLRTTATPLDLSAEVHTRADRGTVEMRKVLADLVAS